MWQQRIIDRLERRVGHLGRVAESLDDELEIYKQTVGHGETLYERYARVFREGRLLIQILCWRMVLGSNELNAESQMSDSWLSALL